MDNENHGAFQSRLVLIENQLISLEGKDRFSNVASWLQTIVMKYVVEDQQIEFLDELSNFLDGYDKQ